MTSPATGASAPAVFHFQSLDVRAFADDAGEPWFCAADVCAVLGYRNDSDAVAKHCRAPGVAKRDLSSGGQTREMTFINEGNLYRLIVKSRKPEAQAFEQQVMEVILPAIRRTGRYDAATHPSLTAPVPTLSKELRGHINRTAHAIALRQYDTIHAILTDCATDNLACGATEQACVGYVDAYADLADGTVLINIRDAQEIVHAVGQVIDQAGSAIAAIRRIEQRSGFNLYPRIKRNEWDNPGFHKHDRLVQEVIDRITGEAE